MTNPQTRRDIRNIKTLLQQLYDHWDVDSTICSRNPVLLHGSAAEAGSKP